MEMRQQTGRSDAVALGADYMQKSGGKGMKPSLKLNLQAPDPEEGPLLPVSRPALLDRARVATLPFKVTS